MNPLATELAVLTEIDFDLCDEQYVEEELIGSRQRAWEIVSAAVSEEAANDRQYC